MAEEYNPSPLLNPENLEMTEEHSSTHYPGNAKKKNIAITCLFGLLVIASIAIASIALDKQASRHSTCNDEVSEEGRRREYSIKIGYGWPGYAYPDESGHSVGLLYDLIYAVCEKAEIICHTVYDVGQNCFVSEAGKHPHGGRGLLDGWYDACCAWVPTVTRVQVFKFSQPFLKSSVGVFVVRADDTSFDPSNFTNKRLGFIDGIAFNENCLARESGTILAKENIVHFKTASHMKTAIVNGKVAAGFNAETFLLQFVNVTNAPLKFIGAPVQCTLGGNAMMTRKDNDFIAKWDHALNELRTTGEFEKMCNEAAKKHIRGGNGAIRCA